MALKYVGTRKHKRWTPGGASGTICPDWTHTVDGRHYGAIEPEQWTGWLQTEAQQMLTRSVVHGDQRYAAARGIAFCGQITLGGTWHGYPVPWRDVPMKVRQELQKSRQVSAREINRGLRNQKSVDPKRDLNWAVDLDVG